MSREASGKLSQIKRLHTGMGIQALINRATEIFGNPIFLFDMEYISIAFPEGVVTDDPFANEFIHQGRLSEKSIAFCRDECFIDAVANCDGVTYLTSEKLKYNRIFGQIYNSKHQPVADLCAVASNESFSEDTPILIRAICEKLSKTLGKDSFYQTYGATYQAMVIHQLIDEDVEDREFYTGHVANIYAGLERNLYLVVVDMDACCSSREQLYAMRDRMNQVRPAFKYATFRNYIVILASTNGSRFHPRRILRGLCDLFVEHGVSAGVSSRFENLFDLPTHYREALSALELARQSDDKLKIALHVQ